LEEQLSPFQDLVESLNRKLHLGKISLAYEGGKLKPRVFAIVDTLTQTILGPLHNDLMSLLRSIEEDCTFDQDKVAGKAKELWLAKHNFYGHADLSNASDRIPMELYRKIGNSMRKSLGSCWLALFRRAFSLGPSVVSS